MIAGAQPCRLALLAFEVIAASLLEGILDLSAAHENAPHRVQAVPHGVDAPEQPPREVPFGTTNELPLPGLHAIHGHAGTSRGCEDDHHFFHAGEDRQTVNRHESPPVSQTAPSWWRPTGAARSSWSR